MSHIRAPAAAEFAVQTLAPFTAAPVAVEEGARDAEAFPPLVTVAVTFVQVDVVPAGTAVVLESVRSAHYIEFLFVYYYYYYYLKKDRRQQLDVEKRRV